jgi:hypothetical protein
MLLYKFNLNCIKGYDLNPACNPGLHKMVKFKFTQTAVADRHQ